MTYTAKAAVCSDIRTKHSTQSEHHAEFLNVNDFDIYVTVFHFPLCCVITN
jgi:hypothetical protein